MGRKSLKIHIEPKILFWARESMGLSYEAVAKKLGTSENSIIAWESGNKKTTLKTLKKLSNIYKRSLATFFLPEPPKESPIPKDFRSLPSEKKKKLSSKTLLAIRNSRRYQYLAIELEKILNRKTVHRIEHVSVSENPENLAMKLRQSLGISIQTQINWKNEYIAFYKWKEILEQTGIFIFQFSMPIEEIRAFSILGGDISIITLSSKDSMTARIFSLFHEYAHIMLNLSGLCNMQEPEDSEENKKVEIFCNHFAGAFLIPKSILPSEPFQSRDIDKTLLELSKKYKVSKEVVLRRMLICNLVNNNLYKKKREEWQVKEWQQRKGGGRNKPERKCLQEKGRNYISLVIEAHKQKKITYKDIADYLSLRTKYIPKVEQLIE